MKVFVTIGSQDPFDRLIRIVDEIAKDLDGVVVTAQTTGADVAVKNIKTIQFIPPAEFRQHLLDADVIVSHAGIGTILNVLELGKPLIVFPREGKFRETRDDHQIATMNALSALGYVNGARTAEELRDKLISILHHQAGATVTIGKYASPELIGSLDQYILS